MLMSPVFVLSSLVAIFGITCGVTFVGWHFKFGVFFATLTTLLGLVSAVALGTPVCRRIGRPACDYGCGGATRYTIAGEDPHTPEFQESTESRDSFGAVKPRLESRPRRRSNSPGRGSGGRGGFVPCSIGGWLLVLVALGAMAYATHFLVHLMRIHFMELDSGYVFDAFPRHCRANTELNPLTKQPWVVQNCAVLADPAHSKETAGISPPRFNASVADVQAFFETALDVGAPSINWDRVTMQEAAQCQVVNSRLAPAGSFTGQNEGVGANKGPMEALTHWRCLSPVLGFADDLIMRVFCDEGQAVAWFFSQSRLGVWDWQHNEFRVRLVASLPTQPWLDRTQLPGAAKGAATQCVAS